MTAFLLSVAISSEVAATLALIASDGLSRPLPAAIVVVGYGISFWMLALVLRHLSVGTTYAVWSAVGTAAIALIGIVLYGEAANAL
jgi:multidrug transporter EmrE-like cation transporter